MVNRVRAGAAQLQKRGVQESEVAILGQASCQDTDQILGHALRDTDQILGEAIQDTDQILGEAMQDTGWPVYSWEAAWASRPVDILRGSLLLTYLPYLS